MSSRLSVTNKTLILICIMYFIVYVDRVNLSTAAIVMQKDLGISNVQLGLIFSLFAYPYGFFQIAGGWIADKFGAKRTIGVFGTIWSAATILTGFVTGMWSMAFARLALGFGEGAAWPSATRAMSLWLPARKRGFAQGITHSCARLGNALTPPLIAFLIAATSWRASFVITGVLSLLWVTYWLLFFRDDPRTHPAITPEEIAELPQVVAGSTRPPTPWRRLFIRVLPATLIDICYGWTLWVYLSWIPSYFAHNYHLDLKNSALFSAGVLFAGMIGDTLGGIASDRIIHKTGDVRRGRRNVIVLGFVGAIVFTAPLLFIHNIVAAAICLSAAFFFAELIVAPLWAVPMDIAPSYAGTAGGLMNVGFAIAGVISPLAFGAIIDATGNWDAPFILSLALMVIGIVLACVMRPDLPLGEVETPRKIAAVTA